MTDQGDPFFALEYVDGEEVTAYCDRRRLDIEDRLRLVVTICRTVQYAHVNLVVHRDLKPSNILVTADGATKLLDFGIAKLLDEDSESSEPLTLEGHRALTPGYAAPEQIRGEKITTATDVYALGVILYELLTGCSPYRSEGSGVRAVERAVCDADPEAPSAARRETACEDVASLRGLTSERLRRRLAGDLDTVVLKALRKEPGRRYPSAEALADDLQRHLDRLPVQARPDTVGYRASKFISRHRLAVTATGASIVALAFGLAGTAWQARVAASQRDRAAQEAARAEQVKDYVLSLFEASNPAQSKGAAITARELLERGVERIDTELAEQPDLQAEMLEVIGGVSVSLGEYERAEELCERALSLRRGSGGNRQAVAEALRRVAQTKHLLGDLAAAETLYREALEIQREELGEEHADVGRTLNDLGVTLGMRGDLAAAEDLYSRSLEIQRRELGAKHPDTIDTLSNLGSILWEKGDFEGGETVAREVLILQREVLGDEHPDVAFGMSSLATMLSNQGKYDEAEELFRAALDLRRRLLGDEHPEVGTTMNNFAGVLRAQGKFTEAEPLSRRVLEIDRKALGDEHPWVAMDLDNLGLALAEQGRLEEGLEYLEKAHAMFVRVLGTDNQRTALSLQYQGVVRYYQGRYDESEQLLSRALATLRVTVGPESPRVATALVGLAAVHAGRGDHARALESYREALGIQRTTLRPEHPDIVPTLVGVGEALMALGRPSEAEPVLREALTLGVSALPAGHWRIALAESALGELMMLTGHEDPRPLLTSGFEGLQRVRGDWHPATHRAGERLRELGRGAPVGRGSGGV